MKKFIKPISIVFALVFLAAGCGGGGSSSSSSPSPTPLTVGGTGLIIDQVPGSAVPAAAATALDINDKNQVVGHIEAVAGSSFTAALWTLTTTGAAAATPTALAPIAGNAFSAAFAIDGVGRAVGQSAKEAQLVAVTWPAGVTVPAELPALNAAGNSAAFGISTDGTCVVGEAQNSALDSRAVIWVADAGGAFTNPPIVLPISFAGSAFSTANGVARTGAKIWIAGMAEDGSAVSHAMLWRSTDGGAVFAAVDLATSGEAGSSALAVNAAGQVAGESETAPGVFAAALWAADNAGLYSRTILAADGVAMRINNSGKTVGTAAGRAAVWDTSALFFATTMLFDTASQSYGSNNGDASGYLVIGVNGGKGFVKKVK